MLTHLQFSRIKLTLLLIIIPFFAIHAQDDLMRILKDELQREMTELKKQETPPYFISLMVTEHKNYNARASFGTLTGSSEYARTFLTVSVRVGDYGLDNSHELRGDVFNQYQYDRSAVEIPSELNEAAIRSAIWREINRKYRQAVETFEKVKANVAIKVKEEDLSGDFANISKAENHYEEILDFADLLGNKLDWENKVKKYSQPFLKEKNIYVANATFNFNMQRKYFLTSEGTSIVHNLTYTQGFVQSMIKSTDGMELPLYKSYFSFLPKGMPDEKIILADVEQMILKLKELYNAPIVEPYTGPAMLSGKSAGVFFHEIFGHRVEGHRMKKSEDAQTFKKKINEKVLIEDLNVAFDPHMKKFMNQDLNGYFLYDDEGIASQKVSVVESGILKNFLMSRAPVENFSSSNGHGRAALGMTPVTRQSNLIVESKKLLSMTELKTRLIDECKKQGKEFGLFFDDVIGGFTTTGRFLPNSFNVTPTVVYKVFADGRPDQLVRGVDLVGTPLLIFSNITSTGNEFGIFNGSCGAESGSVPVSCVSPALLVSQVEVQKKIKSQEKPPLLSRPDYDKAQ
jgi:predicted Zn-dependent protease